MSTDERFDTHEAASRIARAVRDCALVVGLHPGDRDRTRTDHADRPPVIGVRVDPPAPGTTKADGNAVRVVVGVVGFYPTRVEDLAREVRRAVTTLHPRSEITVCVEDVVPARPS